MYHQPVLLKESISGLNIRPDGTYLDLTFGGGGHSREILKYLKKGRLYAFDVDRDAEENALKARQFKFIRGNFRFVKNFLRFHKVNSIDGALADLGISSHHIDQANRGFSYRFDSQLDMRMNQEAEVSAMEVLNTYTKDELQQMFRTYGEVKNAGRLTEKIIGMREHRPIKTTAAFVEGINDCIPAKIHNKYLAQIFQAIRIEVNDELNSLKEMISGVTDVLSTGGRFSIITYHSLEDRLVKNYFKSGNFAGEIETDLYGNRKVPYKPVTRGVVIPGAEEISSNNRARSAKLRIVERIAS